MHLSPSEAQDELRAAYYAGNIERISQLFANAPLDAEDATRALEDSLMEMDPALIRVLLENGADISSISVRDIPRSGQVGELLELLAEYDYDFKADGHRILQDFARDRKTLDWLLDWGVDINRTDTQRLNNGFNLAPGETDSSLHLLKNVAADENIPLFDYLVGRGADVSLSTALHSASACEDPNLSRAMACHLLDKYGMNINSNNDDFRDFVHDADDRGSPLCSAILNRNLAVVLELLERGANPTYPDMYPVSYAVAEDGFLAALSPLLSAGADAASALDIAVGFSNLEAAKICMSFGADPARSLGKAIEQVEDTTQSVPGLMANESPSDPDYEEILEEQMLAERKSRAMVELLRSGSTGDVDA